MAHPKIPETASITLPLDTVLEVLRAAQGNPAEPISAETDGLMKLEVGAALCSLEGLEEEDIAGIMGGTFRDTLGPERCS